MSVADLVQQCCQDRKAARLVINHQRDVATLYFRAGGVQHATLGKVQGEEVVYRTLAWEDGTFTLDLDIKAPATTITRSWSGLLMEGARRLDEGINGVDQDNGVDHNSKADQTWSTQSTELETPIMSQKLTELLKEFSQEVPGILACAVVGMDGLAIAEVIPGVKVKGDEFCSQVTLMIKMVDTTVTKLASGTVDEDLLSTENAYLMLRFLSGKAYFLAVSVDRKVANLGNLRLMSRVYSERLSKALPR